MNLQSLQNSLGNTDIYLIDGILKGYFNGQGRLLDAGCGEGRNLSWFLKQSYQIYGIDVNVTALQYASLYAKTLNKQSVLENFVQSDLANNPFPDEFFDIVLCVAVLHFSKSEAHFKAQWNELVRVLRPGGIFFLRFSSQMGLDYQPKPIDDYRFEMSNGEVWFLPSDELIRSMIAQSSLNLLEPIKSVCVHGQRSMTTLILQKIKS